MNLSFIAIILLVCASALPFASNAPILWQFEALLISLITITTFIAVKKNVEVTQEPVNKLHNFRNILAYDIPVIAWLLLIGLVVTQLFSGSSEYFDTISSSIAELVPYNLGSEIHGVAKTANQFLTLESLLKLMMYGLVFWIVYSLIKLKNDAKQAMHYICIACTLYALYGITNWIFGINKVLWVDKFAYYGVVTSSFINRNSYATFAGLGVLVPLAVLIRQFSIGQFKADSTAQKTRAILFSLNGSAIMYILMIIVGMVAILGTESRGGIFSLFIGMMTFVIALLFTRQKSKFTSVLTLVFAFSVLLIFILLGYGTLLDRIGGGSQGGIRFKIYLDVWRAIVSDPFGYGSGTFIDIYPYLRGLDPSTYFLGSVDKAHNAYLESLLGLGVIGYTLLILPFISIVIAMIIDLRTSINPWYPALGLSVTFLVATHSAIDFSLQIPAVALLYVTILSLCVASARHRYAR